MTITSHLMTKRVVVLVVVALVASLTGCEMWWPSARFDAARTGENITEHTLTLAGVPTLTPRFTAAIGDVDSSWNTPIVAHGFVYVTAHRTLKVFSADGTAGCAGSPSVCQPVWTADLGDVAARATPVVADGSVFVATEGVLQVFDALGRSNCSGTPAVCTPLWTSPSGHWAPPTVSNGLVYLVDENMLAVLDAQGSRGCTGIPKVCAPLWRALPPRFTFSAATALAVDASSLFMVDYDGHIGAYDATASDRCTGTLPTCPLRWTSVFSPNDDGSEEGYLGWTGPVLVGSRLLTYRKVPDQTPAHTSHLQLAAFDAHGVEGCRTNADFNLGGPTICDPVWSTYLSGTPQNTELAAAGDLVFAITKTGPGAESTDRVTAYRVDGVGCTGVPMNCPVQWQSTASLNGNWALPIVANQVLYQGTSTGIAAFDASGASCPGSPCAPAAVVPAPAGTQNVSVSNGRMYVLTTPYLGSGYTPTTATLTMYQLP